MIYNELSVIGLGVYNAIGVVVGILVGAGGDGTKGLYPESKAQINHPIETR